MKNRKERKEGRKGRRKEGIREGRRKKDEEVHKKGVGEKSVPHDEHNCAHVRHTKFGHKFEIKFAKISHFMNYIPLM